MAPKEGDALPDVTLYKDSPQGSFKIREVCAGKKVVIVAVPGAFTPTCSKTHLPSYVTNYDKLKELGVDIVAFVSVNDPFVMSAWGEAQGASNKIEMWADTHSALTEALDLVLDATAFLGNKRSKRYSMLVVDNVIKDFNLEADPGSATCSMADPLMAKLKDQ
ncbi:hypothetical protein BSKO_09496 [Bryopsis sp. KO-2023]|nr:hypothetical protein BSKO_09496 [Bryopsis sp. KO-2023]